MTYTVRARRTAALLASLSLGVLALTACEGGVEEDAAAAPSATASPSPGGAGDGEGSATPSPTGANSDTPSPAGTPSPDDGAGDDQDGGVGMCETGDLDYVVTVAAAEVGHTLLTATNNGGDPCLLGADDAVITVPGLDGAAEHMGPAGTDRMLEPGDRAYAGIMFAPLGAGGDGHDAEQVEIALNASESPVTVPIGGGPVVVDDGKVTSFFGTAEDALSY